MTEKKKVPPLLGGPLPKIAGISTTLAAEVLRNHPEIVTYLRRTAKEVAAHLSAGGTREITPARRILVDRLVTQLAVSRTIEAYVGKAGIIRPDKLSAGALEAHGVIETWLKLQGVINRTLTALGLDDLPEGGPLAIDLIAAEYAQDDDDEPASGAELEDIKDEGGTE